MATKKSDPVSHDGHRQRMKERLLQNGLESFNAHEVMEILLYYALPYKDTNGLGHQIVDSFGGLCNALDADYADLVRTPGITPHVATLITLVGQIAHRYQKERYVPEGQLCTTEALGRLVLPYFVGKRDESVLLISLDNRRKLLNCTRIFEGSVNSTQFNFRQAIQQALRDNATRVVLAHNHPNGFAIPSPADIETTRRFAEVLCMVDMQLVDHLIVSEDDFVSMADSIETADVFRFSKAPWTSPIVAAGEEETEYAVEEEPSDSTPWES